MFTEEFLRQIKELYPDKGEPAESYVYFLHCPETKRIKIGRSGSENLASRISGLKTISSTELLLMGIVLEGLGNTEKELHNRFRELHAKNEWFYAEPALIREIEKLSERSCDNCCRLFIPDYEFYGVSDIYSDYHILCEDCLYEEA